VLSLLSSDVQLSYRVLGTKYWKYREYQINSLDEFTPNFEWTKTK
jgi:hypothetical protein